MKLKNPFKIKILSKYVKIFKEGGFRGLIKEGGWKLLFIFFMYYLIRDSILYILIPYLVVKGFIF
tara:strand:+ start:195 stop:389 length:195 start_codon:yes stop_codon:yes gene_type:complete